MADHNVQERLPDLEGTRFGGRSRLPYGASAGVRYRLRRALEALGFSRLLLLAAVVAACHALVVTPLVSTHVSSDSFQYIELAKGILDGGLETPTEKGLHYSFAPDAAGLEAPETGRTPGYSLVLAALGGGAGGISQWLVLGLQAVLTGATVWLLGLTARRLWSEAPALVGAFGYALDPFSKRYAALVMTEVLAAALLMAAGYAFVRAVQSRSLPWWGASGAAIGALTLVRPFFVVLIALGAIAACASRRRFRAAAAFAAAAILLAAPCVARNWTILGHPTLATWGSGVSLLIAAHGEGHGQDIDAVLANPAYRADFQRSVAFPTTRQEILRDPNSRAVAQDKQDQKAADLGWKLLRHRLSDEPAQVAGEYLYRAYFFWLVASEDLSQYRPSWLLPELRLYDGVLLLLAIAGAVVAIRRGGPGVAIVAVLLVATLAYAVGHVEPRYSVPLRPLEFALAGLGATTLWLLVRRRGRA